MMISGDAGIPGASHDGEGVNFTLFTSLAETVELCLFDPAGREVSRHPLPGFDNNTWHGYLPGCKPSQRYGYRVHGPYAPELGLRFNANKLLIDPYAKALDGEFRWSPEVFDYTPGNSAQGMQFNPADSAPFVPKGIVTATAADRRFHRAEVAWSETVIYEANVRGFTMRHPDIPGADRGKFRGMRNGAVLDYLKALGITSVELMPVHSFIDEAFLARRGLRNFWGYNSINFFVPESRYAGTDPTAEFREMVNAIHDAGMEVILDVVYNHTGESDELGPTISFRGIDNLAYYRTEPGDPGVYVNDTGCGNTLNADHPAVQRLVLDSLRYWRQDMGVDGFRFDLATVLGRSANGFDPSHPLLKKIEADPQLQGAKLIAEPWDLGHGGYRLGQFSRSWAESNDRYRDAARRFWRGDQGLAGEVARRLHGSADLFEAGGRPPCSSINFISSHDGFTLADVVSYSHRHNLANGEDNRDGHAHNFSHNHGHEGVTDDAAINRIRRRQRLNLMATLLLSQGTPMLLAGDEFGNSQQGNNNAYAQDNETGWLDWRGLDNDPEFFQKVSELVALRRKLPPAGLAQYRHDRSEIAWLHPGGHDMQDADWQDARAFGLVLSDSGANGASTRTAESAALLMNSTAEAIEFSLPGRRSKESWSLAFCSHEAPLVRPADNKWRLPDRSIAVLLKK